jgi:hypothetical protein
MYAISDEVAVATRASSPSSVKAKRFAQMAGAAAISVGLVGTFAIPAYATAPEPDGLPDGFSTAQTLETVAADPFVLSLDTPDGAVAAAVVAQEQQELQIQKQKEAEQAAKLAALSAVKGGKFSGRDVPAGVGAQGIVAAAYAQLGDMQDCTALVERSLRAVGIPAGDLGTRVSEYTALGGVEVSSGNYAPGDILIYPGQHVAVYVGNGQAVHGGWGGTTRLGGMSPAGETNLHVVRFFG